MAFKYIHQSLILVSVISLWFNFCFCFFSWYSYRYYKFCSGLKICAITAKTKKYKPIINKKSKKHDKLILLAKTKLNSIEILISKALISSNIGHDEFVSANVFKKI